MFMRGMGGKGHVCACSMEKCNFGQAEAKASPRLQPKADGKVGVSLICRELQTNESQISFKSEGGTSPLGEKWIDSNKRQ